MEEEEKQDDRREAAIASAQPLQPYFKPKGASQHQLSKFQELHRRRLQIKPKSKFTKKPKGIAHGTGKSCGEDLNSKHQDDKDSSTAIEDSSAPNLKSHKNYISSSVQQDNVNLAPKKRQKLHWGYDSPFTSLTPRKGGKGRPTCRNCGVSEYATSVNGGHTKHKFYRLFE